MLAEVGDGGGQDTVQFFADGPLGMCCAEGVSGTFDRQEPARLPGHGCCDAFCGGEIHGRVGGFLGNRKANANLLLKGVKEFLEKDFELREAVAADKYVYSRPAADDIIDDLASRCDFVVTAIAD